MEGLTRRRPWPDAAAVTSYAALAALLTWPLPWHLASVVPIDVGDPVLNTWILWWNAHHVPLTASWWNAPAFFPATGVLGFSEHLLGLTVVSSPVIWLSGNPQLAYNLIFLLSFPLSAVAAYGLGLHLTGRRDAAWLGGLAFGFAPYRIAQLAHLQMLASWWIPLALLGLHGYVRDGHRRWLALFGAAWLLQALSNGYLMLFSAVLVALWIAWFVPLREWRKGAAIVAAWAIAAVPLVPVLWRYRATHAAYGLTRDLNDLRVYSADVASALVGSPLLSLWGRIRVYERPEGQLYTGFAILVVVALGLVWRRRVARPPVGGHRRARSALAFYVLAALAMYLLALGPEPTWLGKPVGIPGPYAALLHLPGFGGLRVPARFAMVSVACLAAAVPLAFAALTDASRRTARMVVAPAVALALVGETWIGVGTMPYWDIPKPWDIAPGEVTRALLVLPVLNEKNDAMHMYRAMTLGRPLVNGYSGYLAPWYVAMKEGLAAGDPAVLEELSGVGVTQVAVITRNDRDHVWADYVQTRATFARASADGSVTLYDLRAPAARPSTDLPDPVPIAAIRSATNAGHLAALTDGDIATRWYTTGTQSGGEELLIDLGADLSIAGVELCLGRWVLAFPRELVVAISSDGDAWTEAWQGRGDLPAFEGGLREPNRMPLWLDTGGRTGRFLRIRQVGQRRDREWVIAELRVRARATPAAGPRPVSPPGGDGPGG